MRKEHRVHTMVLGVICILCLVGAFTGWPPLAHPKPPSKHTPTSVIPERPLPATRVDPPPLDPKKIKAENQDRLTPSATSPGSKPANFTVPPEGSDKSERD